MEPQELRAALEAILFVSNEPVKIDDFVDAFSDEGKDAIIAQLEDIKRTLDDSATGFILEQAAGGWRYATRPEHDSILKKFFAKKGENRMSIAALETLAIVAYRQPITAPEISDIRGVNTTGVIRTLLDRRMIRVSGRKNVVGSPFLYRTTREFLVHFGLNDIRDLPRLEEFGDLIGENLNEELVSAINAAADSSATEIPLGDEPAPANDSGLDSPSAGGDVASGDAASELHEQSNEDDVAQADDANITEEESESRADESQLESSRNDQQE